MQSNMMHNSRSNFRGDAYPKIKRYSVLPYRNNSRHLACPPAGAVSWRRAAGAAAESDSSIRAANEYCVDGQKPAHHPHLPCRLWHGSFALSDESGQDPRRRGTRLCPLGQCQ